MFVLELLPFRLIRWRAFRLLSIEAVAGLKALLREFFRLSSASFAVGLRLALTVCD